MDSVLIRAYLPARPAAMHLPAAQAHAGTGAQRRRGPPSTCQRKVIGGDRRHVLTNGADYGRTPRFALHCWLRVTVLRESFDRFPISSCGRQISVG